MTENFATKLRSFESKILYFNGLYKLPVAAYPTWNKLDEPAAERVKKFKDILIEECKELDEITVGMADESDQLTFLTNMADLLGDIVVYCSSEAAKYGIPLNEVLNIIMDSNFSKLGADGNPIYDERGKVMKGPNYWKPEPKIKELLEERIRDAKQQRVSG